MADKRQQGERKISVAQDRKRCGTQKLPQGWKYANGEDAYGSHFELGEALYGKAPKHKQ